MAASRSSAATLTPAVAVAASDWHVWGHDTVVAGLADAVARDRVRHAYLFGGPAGVGKSTVALAFAAALCCSTPPEPGVPCGTCLSCRKIARGVHPDVQTFDLASQAAASERSGSKNTTMTVETMRQVSASAALRPTESRWRVLLIDDAESLQEVAQEALLKTLEEPPRFVVILLLTDDPESLLPTIRSRCQEIDFRRVPRATVEAALTDRGVSPDQAAEVAGLTGGLPGLALATVGNTRALTSQREAIDAACDWIASPAYDRLVTAVRLGDTFSKRRADVFLQLESLLGVWRDALLLHAAQPTYLTYRGIAERLHATASTWSLAEVQRGLCSVRQCIADLEANVRPRLALEAMVLQWPIAQTTS